MNTIDNFDGGDAHARRLESMTKYYRRCCDYNALEHLYPYNSESHDLDIYNSDDYYCV